MSAPTLVPTKMPYNLLVAYIALGTVKVMLVDDAATVDQDTLDFIDDVSANESAGTSYPTGGITLTGVVVNLDTATNKSTVDADDVTTAGLSVLTRWAFIYVDTGAPSTSLILGYSDLSQGVGGNVTCTGINWNTAGIIPAVAA
jgi:prolyl-tRNA editing enzyme YbaK/EbsC (Cys-tRNA(Pro) deacylase)